MNYLLFDYSRTENSFISKLWCNSNLKEVYSNKYKHKIVGWLQGAFQVLQQSRKDDTIICWFDFQAVLVYWLCTLTFCRRNIVCINVMLKDNETLRNKIIGFLYKKALSSNCFKASVTSIEYGQYLNYRFGKNYQFQLIRDVFHKDYTLKEDIQELPKTVFCGGNNGRDWHFMLKVAKKLPDVNFRFVVPNYLLKSLLSEVPQNVTVRCNIPYIEFLREMCASTIVALPLDTIAPAGLIVLFQAAANQRLVMMTDTVTTRGYITPDRGVLLPNDAEQWVDSILFYFANPLERSEKAKNLQKFLETECSEDKFVNSIKKMI